MTFQNTISPIIEELTELNSILNRNNVTTSINIKNIIDTLVQKEKDYQILKFNIEQSEENLQDNIKLLKSKCDLEFKIYSILSEHKQRLNKLKKDHGELPEIDEFIEKLFDLSKDDVIKQLNTVNTSQEQKKPKIPLKKSSLSTSSVNSNKSQTSSKQNNKPAIKLDSMCLQSQLNAAIKSRKNKLDNLS